MHCETQEKGGSVFKVNGRVTQAFIAKDGGYSFTTVKVLAGETVEVTVK